MTYADFCTLLATKMSPLRTLLQYGKNSDWLTDRFWFCFDLFLFNVYSFYRLPVTGCLLSVNTSTNGLCLNFYNCFKCCSSLLETASICGPNPKCQRLSSVHCWFLTCKLSLCWTSLLFSKMFSLYIIKQLVTFTHILKYSVMVTETFYWICFVYCNNYNLLWLYLLYVFLCLFFRAVSIIGHSAYYEAN
jgi:hypothetical protein